VNARTLDLDNGRSSVFAASISAAFAGETVWTHKCETFDIGDRRLGTS
jgi:hypothetical protein